MLTCLYSCRILAHGPNVMRKIAWVGNQLHADVADPWEFECRSCHSTWMVDGFADPREVTCSNCYSTNIVISALRLGFENWGEQNGGEREQRERYDSAMARPMARALVEI